MLRALAQGDKYNEVCDDVCNEVCDKVCDEVCDEVCDALVEVLLGRRRMARGVGRSEVAMGEP